MIAWHTDVNSFGLRPSLRILILEKVTSNLWKTLKFSTTYHPQTNGQSERMIQTLEVMLRIYVLDLKGHWDEHLPLVEFAYNNNYQASMERAP